MKVFLSTSWARARVGSCLRGVDSNSPLRCEPSPDSPLAMFFQAAQLALCSSRLPDTPQYLKLGTSVIRSAWLTSTCQEIMLPKNFIRRLIVCNPKLNAWCSIWTESRKKIQNILSPAAILFSSYPKIGKCCSTLALRFSLTFGIGFVVEITEWNGAAPKKLGCTDLAKWTVSRS